MVLVVKKQSQSLHKYQLILCLPCYLSYPCQCVSDDLQSITARSKILINKIYSGLSIDHLTITKFNNCKRLLYNPEMPDNPEDTQMYKCRCIN